MQSETEARQLMLEIQVEELAYWLSKEEEGHRKASARASAADRKNKMLREQTAALEGQLHTLEQCWNCPDLGNRTICAKCTNNSVFSRSGNIYVWNDPRCSRKEGIP